jgi:hypothetical protein
MAQSGGWWDRVTDGILNRIVRAGVESWASLKKFFFCLQFDHDEAKVG